jgi:hypothetical protein
MSGKPMQQLSQPAQPQQQQAAPAPAAAAAADIPAVDTRTPSPPNRGAPTFNGRNWL